MRVCIYIYNIRIHTYIRTYVRTYIHIYIELLSTLAVCYPFEKSELTTAIGKPKGFCGLACKK